MMPKDKTVENEHTNVALLANDIGYIKKSLDILISRFDNLESKYVTKIEFWPVRSIVYGGASLILIGVLATIILMATGGSVHIQR